MVPRSMQAPLPSQLRPFWSVVEPALKHCAAEQGVVMPGYTHSPVRPHDDLQIGSVPGHSLRGSVPACAWVHLPIEPLRLQAKQLPAHAVSQHTLSTQFPDEQSLAAVHG